MTSLLPGVQVKMTRRKLNIFLAVTAIVLQTDIARGFPSQRYSPYLMQSARQNAVDTPDSNTFRFLKQMELDQTMQRQYSSDVPVNSDLRDPWDPLNRDLTPEEGLDEGLELAHQESNFDARRTDLNLRAYYGQQPEDMYRENDPMRSGGITFLSEEEEAPTEEEDLMPEEFYMRDDFPVRAEDMLQRMYRDDMENIGGGYSLERAGDLQELTRQEDLEGRSIFREGDSLRQQELLDEAIREEEILQDVSLREASSLRQVNALRDGHDPLQQFEVARDAFIYKEEIRQGMLREQALRQEILRQEALRQENVFREDPKRQIKTLRQESDILRQLIQQEELRQENARNLEDAYRDEAEIRQDDPEAEQMLLQRAQLQESIRQESEKRQEEAIRQRKLVRKKLLVSKKKILQQVCINCGPKIVSVSNSHNIQV